jgi:ketosteroid isomerase-like protein
VRELNLRALEAFYERQRAFYAGEEADPLEELLADDVVWHVPGSNAIAGDYEGVEAVAAYFRKRRDQARGTFRITIRHTLADDDYVVQLADGEAELEGQARTWRTIGLYRFDGGRISECWLLPFDQHAFDEIWS